MHIPKTFLLALLLPALSLADDPTWDRETSAGTKGLSRRDLNPLAPRQTEFASGATCADAFGPGNIPCGTGINCYNPTAGESCCTNGKYCPAGESCAVGGGCNTGGDSSATGKTCAEAFGPTFIRCGSGTGCYDPVAGESCCTDGKYCPAGSSCLTGGGCSGDGSSALASGTHRASSVFSAATFSAAATSFAGGKATTTARFSTPPTSAAVVTALATGSSQSGAGAAGVLSPMVAVVVGLVEMLGFML